MLEEDVGTINTWLFFWEDWEVSKDFFHSSTLIMYFEILTDLSSPGDPPCFIYYVTTQFIVFSVRIYRVKEEIKSKSHLWVPIIETNNLEKVRKDKGFWERTSLKITNKKPYGCRGREFIPEIRVRKVMRWSKIIIFPVQRKIKNSIWDFPLWHKVLRIQLQQLKSLQSCGFNPLLVQWVKGSGVATAAAQI